MRSFTEIFKEVVYELENDRVNWNDRLDHVAKEAANYTKDEWIKGKADYFAKKAAMLFYDESTNARRKFKTKVRVEVAIRLGNIKLLGKAFEQLCKDYTAAGCQTEYSGMNYVTQFSTEYTAEFRSIKEWKEHRDFEPIIQDGKVISDWRRPGNCMGNGYNDLEGSVITDYLDRLYECLKGIKVTVNTRGLRDGNFLIQVWINPLKVDENKLRKLSADFKTDPEIQRAAEKMASVSKGIAAYYAEKSARGDHYTGD